MAETHAANPANTHSMPHPHLRRASRRERGRGGHPHRWVSRRRDHGGLIFCDLRDREGITQINFDPEHSDGDASRLPRPCARVPILVHGVVRSRGEDAVNPKLATGEIEVLVDHAQVLNRSKTPPFQIEDGIETAEDTRLRYRYLDLRRPEMAARLRLRSDFTFAIRSALHDRAFTEVETPALFKSTPEARATSWCPAVCSPATSMPFRSPRSSSSSCSWWAASSATTRLPSASVTRTCAPTAARVHAGGHRDELCRAG